MDLVVKLDSKNILIDVTTIDANNPSNGFVKDSEILSSYFPGAAAVIYKPGLSLESTKRSLLHPTNMSHSLSKSKETEICLFRHI